MITEGLARLLAKGVKAIRTDAYYQFRRQMGTQCVFKQAILEDDSVDETGEHRLALDQQFGLVANT